jgi:hypothetical protein
MISANQVTVQFDRAQPTAASEELDAKQTAVGKFAGADLRGQAKLLKELATVTEHDALLERRQKSGQLRYGDVIALTYQEDVHWQALKDQYDEEAIDAMIELNAQEGKGIGQADQKIERKKILDEPDFVYRGMLYSDGITDSNLKVIPSQTEGSMSASNMFKQCLFMVEIQQECEVNKKANKLTQKKVDVEHRLQKMIADQGGEGNIDFQQLKTVKDELDKVLDEIEENKTKKAVQDENNVYEQKYRLGNKLTYGAPFQLRHLFSGKYLTLNLNEMSQEYGCCEMFLSETTEDSVFVIEPSNHSINQEGYVVNFNDFFHIRSKSTSTPFYLHVFKKIFDLDFQQQDKQYLLNASQTPSKLKAKLFMDYRAQDQAKAYIQSGDVIRLKHLEVESYLTASNVEVDLLIPSYPDFLRGQIRRMNAGYQIELPKGGKDRQELTEAEKQEIANDQEYEQVIVSKDHVKKLKSKQHQFVYIERNQERLLFTNSCWEIQRVNTLQGGDVELEEVIRLKHIGTGKFLSVADDRQELVLRDSGNSLSCLFMIKQEMALQKKAKFYGESPEGHDSRDAHLRNNQKIMIQSYLEDKFLQIFDDVEEEELTQFEHKVNHVNEQFMNYEESKESHMRIINHKFQKIEKQKMMFQIEEVPFEQSIQAYQSSQIFDEMLEYYAFLNCWGVAPNEQHDQVEKFYIKHDLANEQTDDLYDKTQKMLTILQNLEEGIMAYDDEPEALLKVKTQFQEQGILDILCRILDVIYYKTVPPPMFQKPFKSTKTRSENEHSNNIDFEHLRIDEYLAQQISRDNLEPLIMKTLELLLIMSKGHRANSEAMTKYFNTLYQHYHVQENYFQLNIIHPDFKTTNPKNFMEVLGTLFMKAQKNSMFVHADRSSNALVQHAPSKQEKAIENFNAYLGVDSNKAIQNIESSNDVNQIQKWLDLLEPVKFKNQEDQNLDKQITILNIISMFCRQKDGKGVYPYQMQVTQHVFEKDDNILLRFGTAKVGNVLRPFVYFVRPKNQMDLEKFLENNPTLAQIQDNFNMQQRNQQQYELIFDLHEMTRNYETKGKETWPYIDYICAVINLYAHMCLSANTKAIKQMADVGLDEAHILLCIHEHHEGDGGGKKEKLLIHEKIKQSYMFLTRCMFVENDPVSPGIALKNRCYIWEKLDKKEKEKREEGDSDDLADDEDELNFIENDFYAGKAKKKLTQMEDPNNSMIVLRYEQESKDLALIRMIKSNISWFLQEGPTGTESFFYSYEERKFVPSQLKLKIKSVKIYFDTTLALVSEDCVDQNFIETIKLASQCALIGSLHYPPEKKHLIPEYVTESWLYKLCWLAKDIYLTNPKECGSMERSLNSIQCKILDIFEKLSAFRLNF